MKTTTEIKLRRGNLTGLGTNGDTKKEIVTITPPKMAILAFTLRGTTILCVNRFSKKAQDEMAAKQAQGQLSQKGKKREAKDFERCYQEARHVSTEGWDGVAASGFRCALISACRLVNFKMTLAKLAVFIEADGFDRADGTPLVRITKGEPRRDDGLVRLPNGSPDIRPRPQWAPGWEIKLRIRYDADLFSATDITNLLARVGLQIGIGEGRPDSKNSSGLGYGLFEIINDQSL